MLLVILLGALVVTASTIVGALLGRSYERNLWQQHLLNAAGIGRHPQALPVSAASDVQFTEGKDTPQLAQAVEAIALEVERIGEGQRFLTRLLANRDSAAGGARTPSPTPGSVRAPHAPRVS